MEERRKTPKLKERLTPCECCFHPLSNRHHVLDFAEFGETDECFPFCPNCHELYHICFKAYKKPTRRIAALWNGFIAQVGINDRRIPFLISRVLEAEDAKVNARASKMDYDETELSWQNEA